MFVVCVQHTETLELDMFGPYDTWDDAVKAAQDYRRHMDNRDDFTAVYSVWPVNIRTMEQSVSAHMSYRNLFVRADDWARTLDNPMGLDK